MTWFNRFRWTSKRSERSSNSAYIGRVWHSSRRHARACSACQSTPGHPTSWGGTATTSTWWDCLQSLASSPRSLGRQRYLLTRFTLNPRAPVPITRTSPSSCTLSEAAMKSPLVALIVGRHCAASTFYRRSRAECLSKSPDISSNR